MGSCDHTLHGMCKRPGKKTIDSHSHGQSHFFAAGQTTIAVLWLQCMRGGRFRGSVAGLFGLSGLSRVFRSLNQTNQRNQTNQMNQLNQIPATRRETVPDTVFILTRPNPPLTTP